MFDHVETSARDRLEDAKIINDFHEIDVLKGIADIMFEKYKKEISAMEKNHGCDVFSTPKNQTENKIYMYG